MIKIQVDSELTTDLIPAKPIKAGDRFVAIKDKDSKLACFTLTDEKKLNLILSINGVHTILDFGKLVGIEGHIQAFDVQQAQNLDLDICIAVGGGGSTTLWLLHKVDVANISTAIPASSILKATGIPPVHHIFMSNFNSVEEYPLIIAAFEPIGKITKEEQIGFIRVADGVLSLDTSWSLDTSAEEILDVSFGKSPLGDGLFVLYEFGGKKKVQFKLLRGDGGVFVVEPKIPEDTQCIATFVDPAKNISVLVTGGVTITAFTSSEYMSPQKEGHVISSKEGGSLDIKDMHIAQHADDVRIFYTTADESLSYYDGIASKLSAGSTISLLTEGNATRVSSILAASENPDGCKAKVNTLLSVDEDGNLSVLQQSTKTSKWQKYPFYHASDTDNIEVKGYTVRIQAIAEKQEGDDTNEDIVANSWLLVATSGIIKGLVNGREIEFSAAGTWLRADENGLLTILFTTTDAAGQNVHVQSFRPGKAPEKKITAAKQVARPGNVVRRPAMLFGWSDIGGGLEDAWNYGSHAVEDTWNFEKHTVEKIGGAIGNAAGSVGRAAGGVIHVIGGLFS
ncbi:hypothetical protein TWF481_006386 [Arthrobotrys musiformis]|uniref:Uncharacterized protein n=1 Tax=Arthrobotrys musiformis TaxID=47236 RepID=A0AAV9WHP4_9PEZI